MDLDGSVPQKLGEALLDDTSHWSVESLICNGPVVVSAPIGIPLMQNLMVFSALNSIPMMFPFESSSLMVYAYGMVDVIFVAKSYALI